MGTPDFNIRCLHDELASVNSLKPHPKNRNIHPKEQIERLAKILAYQGIRAPVVVSRLSGFIVKGHGTLQAIRQNGWKQAPVVYQEFESEEQEYAFVQSDNAVASWAELDLAGINADIGDLGPDFDVDLLGLKDFNIVPEFNPGNEEDQGKLDQKKPVVTQCPNCGECFDANENKPQN